MAASIYFYLLSSYTAAINTTRIDRLWLYSVVGFTGILVWTADWARGDKESTSARDDIKQLEAYSRLWIGLSIVQLVWFRAKAVW